MNKPQLIHTLSLSTKESPSSSQKRKHPGVDDTTEERSNTNTSSKRSSQQPTAFSAGVRRNVLKWDGGRCWFCGATPAQVAHVIGQKDNGFDDLVANRLLCFQDLANQDNAIPLCPLCHSNFDDLNQPGLIFIPTDLEYFIEYEKADQKRRRETARIQRDGRSAHITRFGVPSPQEYQSNSEGGALYTRYYLRRYFPEFMATEIGQFGEPKYWHGSPSAALRRAHLLLGNTVVKGLPRDVRRQLSELANLYLDLDLESELEVEAVASSPSDSSERTRGTGRCPPSAPGPGTQGKGKRSMGEGQNSSESSGGIDDGSGPRDTCGHAGDSGTAFPVDEDDSGEWLGGKAEEGNEASLKDCHYDTSPKVPSHPSLIRSITSTQPDSQPHDSDPSLQRLWTWGPYSTSQKVIEFICDRNAITSRNTQPLIVDATLESKYDQGRR